MLTKEVSKAQAKKQIFTANFSFAGISINNLTRQEALSQLDNFLFSNQPALIFTPNADHFVLLQKDEIFRQAYEKASLVLPDGMSLLFISRLFGQPLRERIAGADLFPEICALAARRNKRLFLLGGESGSEKIAIKKINHYWPNLEVAAYSPPFGFESDQEETEKILGLIREFSTDILCCFVGSPKSEKWLYLNYDRLQVKLATSFGATLNYFTGRKKRAPLLWRHLGLEWAWRLIHEPKRLAKRYLLGNWQFLALVIKEFFKQRKLNRV